MKSFKNERFKYLDDIKSGPKYLNVGENLVELPVTWWECGVIPSVKISLRRG